jgi:hypothetical protein
MQNSYSANRKKILGIALLLIFICIGLLYTTNAVKAQDVSFMETLQNFGGGANCNIEWFGVKNAIAGLIDLVVIGPKITAYFASELASSVIGYVLEQPITTGEGFSAAFMAGWRSTRDLGNMLIVLGFVIIGLATALRIKEYEAKKALLPLIISALLINFSGLICGIIIDASNLVMNGLMGTGATPAHMGKNFFTNITKMEAGVKCPAYDQGLGQYAAVDFGFAVMYLLIAITFLYLAIMMAARYGILGILFVFSPLAFVFWSFPFPKAKDLWNKWWSNFLKYAFVGVGICFFLNLAGQMVQAMKILTSTSFMDILMHMLIVNAVIVVGIYISLKSSGALSAAVMGAVLATGGFIAGAVSKGTGLTKLAQKGADRATALGEKYMPKLVKPGTLDARKANRLTEPTKRLENIQDNQQLAKIAESRAVSPREMADKAAAAQILAKRGKFDAISADKRDAVAAHAVAMGVSKDTFTKAQPGIETARGQTEQQAAAYQKEQAEKQAIAYQKQHGGSIEDARNAIRIQQQQDLGADATLYQQQHGGSYSSARRAVIEQRARGVRTAVRQQQTINDALGISPVSDRDARNKILDDYRKKLAGTGLSNRAIAQKVEQRGASLDTERGARLIAAKRREMSEEAVQKAMGKLDVAGIRNAPKEVLSHPDFIKNIGAQRLDRAIQEMPQEKINELKKHTDMTSKEGAALHKYMADLETKSNAGDQKAYEEWKDLVDKMQVIEGS